MTRQVQIPVKQDHVYYIKGCPIDGYNPDASNGTYDNRFAGSNNTYLSETGTGLIWRATYTGNLGEYIRFNNGFTYQKKSVFTPSFIDLTQIYGSGNEPSSVAAFEADYFKWFGHPLCYEPYDPGSIRNTKINSLKTVGFNQWDENWEANILLNQSTGEKQSQSGFICTQNFIPVINNKTYYIKYPVDGIRLVEYDHNKNYIRGRERLSGNLYDMHMNTYYILFCNLLGYTYGTVYQNDICLNISDSKLNGTYEAYEDRTYSIPITSITGKLNGTGNSVTVFPEGMKSAGSVADEIVVEGGVTKAIKRIGTMELGTQNWYRDNSEGSWRWLINRPNNVKESTENAIVSPILMYRGGAGSIPDLTIGIGVGPIAMRNNNLGYDDVNILKQWLNNNNAKMNYELTTPEVYVLDNFNLPLNVKVWKSGTERYESSDSTGTSPKLTIHYNAQ